MKKILVTGATGYIGSKLVNKLVQRKLFKVYVLVRPSSNLKYNFPSEKQVGIVEYTGLDSLLSFFEKTDIDLVVHLAAYVGVVETASQIKKNIESNLLLSINLLEAMRFNGVDNIINTGSYWEFGDIGKEQPNSIYAVFKTTTRKLIQLYKAVSELKYINLILYDVFGEDDHREKLLNKLLSIEKDEPFPMTLGYQKLFFVHVDDVIRGYELSISKLLNNKLEVGTYHLRGSNLVNLRELVVIIEKIIKRRLSIEWGKIPYPDRQIMRAYHKGPQLPGWQASIDLEEGIQKMGRYKKDWA